MSTKNKNKQTWRPTELVAQQKNDMNHLLKVQ